MRRLAFIVVAWLAALAVVCAATVSADEGTAEGMGVSPVAAEEPDPPKGGLFEWWPSQKPERGHDKCKRRRGWALPLWCFGLSSWPLLKGHTATASVLGIRANAA